MNTHISSHAKTHNVSAFLKLNLCVAEDKHYSYVDHIAFDLISFYIYVLAKCCMWSIGIWNESMEQINDDAQLKFCLLKTGL